MKTLRHAPSRGVTLLEALIALLISATGLLALAGVQAQLLQGSTASRHLSLAVHALQQTVEQADGATPAPLADSAPAGTDIRLSLTPQQDPILGPVNIGSAEWTDARGLVSRFQLVHQDAPRDAQLVALQQLPLRPLASSTAPGWPVEVRAVDDKRALFQPVSSVATGWLLERETGAVLATCALPTPTDADLLPLCPPTGAAQRWPLSGHIQFTPAAARRWLNDPALSATTEVRLRLENAAPQPCPTARVEPSTALLRYHCLTPDTPWNGRTELGGLPLDGAGFRVCRYSRDHDGNGSIEASEHPAVYQNVRGALNHQNFLVALQGEACPMEGPDATQPHQP